MTIHDIGHGRIGSTTGETTADETPDWGAPRGPVPDLLERLRESLIVAKEARLAVEQGRDAP